MNKNSLFATIMSLENEIEFLKSVKKPYIKQKIELNKLYDKVKNLDKNKGD